MQCETNDIEMDDGRVWSNGIHDQSTNLRPKITNIELISIGFKSMNPKFNQRGSIDFTNCGLNFPRRGVE